MKRLIIPVLLATVFCSNAQSLRELYQEGISAYEDTNYERFKQRMFSIDSIRPNYPPVVYNLAAGYALTGNNERAIEVLNQYILMDATKDLASDDDFSSLKELPEFRKILDQQKLLTREIPVDIAHQFPILSSHSESLTYSKSRKSYFIGGVRDGSIWKIKEGETPELWAASGTNSWAVMGIEASKDGKTLWACTSAMDNYADLKEEDKGKVSVLKYDLKKGKLLETFTLPANHNFGDMICDSKGNAYISDGVGNQLYWISQSSGELELFADLSQDIINLQGLTLTEDESAMYLSDYIDGIYKLDMRSKKLTKLETSAGVLLKGIDGLYLIGNELIGLHNGTQPNRVVKYQLNDEGLGITGKTIVSQADVLGEPTQGVVVDNKFFYIANSPWGSYDREGNFSITEGDIIIGQIN